MADTVDEFEFFLEKDWSDGFPVVTPTEERVEWMLEGTRRDPDEVVGAIPPAGEIASVRTAPIHDHIKGRKSEMEFISGLVARKGRELGIATPCNDAVVEIDRQINKGLLKMDRSNFELLKARIGAT